MKTVVYAHFGKQPGPFLTREVPHKKQNGRLYVKLNIRWRAVRNDGVVIVNNEPVKIQVTEESAP